MSSSPTQSSRPRPPRACNRREAGESQSEGSSQPSQADRRTGRNKLSLDRANEMFGDIISRRFRDPGTPGHSYRDKGIFECTRLAVVRGKPVVHRTRVDDSAASFEEHDPMDLSEVLEYLAPEVIEGFDVLQRFSLTQVTKKFDMAMEMLNNSQTNHSLIHNEEIGASRRRQQRTNGHNSEAEEQDEEDEDQAQTEEEVPITPPGPESQARTADGL